MTGTLRARIQRLERPAEKQSGGLYWLQVVAEDEALPTSYSVGGLHVIYARQAEIDAVTAASKWRPRSRH